MELRVFAILSCCIAFSDGANILFFYGGGTYSHKLTVWPLMSALADRGHNITVLSCHNKRPWVHPGINEIIPAKLEKLLSVFHVLDKLEMRLSGNERMVWDSLSWWSLNICETILSDNEDTDLQNLLHNDGTKIDLIFTNAAFGECAYIFREKWGSKLILMDSTTIISYFHDMLGLVLETNWIPDISSQFVYPMTFINRVRNYLYPLLSSFERHRFLYPALEKLMSNYLCKDNLPKFHELERNNTNLVFMNTHYTTEFARALPPNYIHVGGLHIWEQRKQPMPEEIQIFMDNANEDAGVALIVFGTSYDISKTNQHFLNMFFDAMSSFPSMRFIVNWEGEVPKDVPRNALLAKWLPQKEILAHPKVKVFITHCGLYSISEATYHGVPMIGLPLVADEDYDAYRIVMEGIGIALEVKTLTTTDLIAAIDKITRNPSYKANILNLQKMTRDRPMDPLTTAIWWTEFLLRQNNISTMRPRNDHLTWYELRMLDIHTFFIFVTLIGLYIVTRAAKALVSITIGTGAKPQLQ